jgi:alanine-glyoxylate transaminase/serine-glyoxylate transaminase/serine-pyruvate transaminase
MSATTTTGGRHFLQIPGPTNVPDRVLRAMAAPTIDHRGPEFAALGLEVLEAVKPVFGTTQPVVFYPASGTGAWEAALTNTLSPGDKVLAFADPDAARERLAADTGHDIKAVMVVHNETSTGVTSRVSEVRRAMDDAGHPALLLVDTISSLGSIRYEHDEWGVDVTVAGSQKGLMLPPGLSFNAVSEKALQANKTAGLPRSFFDWQPILAANQRGFWPYTPATNLLYALREALTIMQEEGLAQVYARHTRHAEATRAAVRGWGLEVLALDEREYSGSLTAIWMPDGGADAVREVILREYDMSLGAGLGKLADKVFRIGHLGHFNDLTLVGTLGGVQMGLVRAGVQVDPQGIQAALERLQQA